MSEENQPLISAPDTKKAEKSASSYHPIRESPDTSTVHIGGGPMDESSDTMKNIRGTEEERHIYNPLLNRILENPTSNLDTMIHLLKGNIGTGILAMPDAFRNSGWLVGIFGTMFMAVICTHCMHILVYCSQELCRRIRVPTLGFANVAEVAFDTGPRQFQKYSKLARRILLCIFRFRGRQSAGRLPRTSTVHAFAPLDQLPLYFGTAIYAFEGISLVLPLENNMETPQDFGGYTGVLNTGMFYVPMSIIWPTLSQRFPTEVTKKYGEYVVRVVLIMFTFVLAAVIPNLSSVISLVGSVSSSMLALIFPPLIELVTFWDAGISRYTIAKDIFIALFGLLGFVAGSYTSILNILNGYD
ncbi:hypothetical protein U1Q18_048996 [Sarracenia purpurea var. burkii]